MLMGGSILVALRNYAIGHDINMYFVCAHREEAKTQSSHGQAFSNAMSGLDLQFEDVRP